MEQLNLIAGSANNNLVLTSKSAAEIAAYLSKELGELVYQNDGSVGLKIYDGTTWKSIDADIQQQVVLVDTLPGVGEANVIYVTKNDGAVHYWNTNAYKSLKSTKADIVDSNNAPVVYADSTNKINTDLLPTGLVVKDSVSNKINASDLPSIAISNTFVIGNSTGDWSTGLVADIGDVAILSDQSKSFIKKDNNGVLADWTELLSPTNGVSSVVLAGTTTALTGPVTNIAANNINNKFSIGQTFENTTGNSIVADQNIESKKQLVSSVANGTAPLVVTSKTVVDNLNVKYLNSIEVTGTPTNNQLLQFNGVNASWATLDAVTTDKLGANSGVATLDTTGKLTANQIPSSLLSGLTYKGTWNATSNTPVLSNSVGVEGNYYIVGTAGTTTIDGINAWGLGDWIVFNGGKWQKVDNTDSVTLGANTFTGNQTAPVFVSNVAVGTAPLQVTSTTVVPNLNVENIKGVTISGVAAANKALVASSATAASWADFPVTLASNTFTATQNITSANNTNSLVLTTSGTGKSVVATGNIETSKQLASTVATGTAPLSIASTTVVPNLNVNLLNGITIANTAPAIGYSLMATSATGAEWRAPVPVNATTSGAITAAHAGQTLRLTGAVTIANNILPAGFSCVLHNANTADITLTCSATSTFISGSDTNNSGVALKFAKKGLLTVLAISPTEIILCGEISV